MVGSAGRIAQQSEESRSNSRIVFLRLWLRVERVRPRMSLPACLHQCSETQCLAWQPMVRAFAMRSNLDLVVSKFYLGNQEVNAMAREAKLFVSSSGSAVRGFSKFRANIPPRWIKNARYSRKRIEPEIVGALRSVKSIQRNRPRAQVALRTAKKQFKAVLSRWETAYNKENFYRGIRILLELQRNGSSIL